MVTHPTVYLIPFVDDCVDKPVEIIVINPAITPKTVATKGNPQYAVIAAEIVAAPAVYPAIDAKVRYEIG